MKRDARDLALSSDSTDAAELFDCAVEHYLKFHADTMTLVGRMLVADPHFVMGHCLKGVSAAKRLEPRQPARDRRNPGGGAVGCSGCDGTRTVARRRLRGMVARCARPVVWDMAADP